MKLKLLLPAMLFLFVSCKVSLISKYDASVLDDVKTGQSLTKKLFVEAVSNPDKSYTANSSNYELVSGHIASLKKKEAAREKSKILVAMVENIEKAFNKIKSDHQARGNLNDAELTQYQQVSDRQWKSLINAEKNLPK